MHRFSTNKSIMTLAIGLTIGLGCGDKPAPSPTTNLKSSKDTNITTTSTVEPKKQTDHKYTNRLIKEKSPYLLQHAHNPVDWFPWGKEAFDKAKKEDKPVFLSVGYSTCHWCHVMERESFENEEVGALLNKHFICVKLDREERPDIDKIYMTFVQATTGGGGWPMSVFMTPDQKPFFGGTYFRKPDFMNLCERVNQLWNDKEMRPKLEGDADRVSAELAKISAGKPSPDAKLYQGMITNAVEQIKNTYDSRFGGFGRAPKFPRPSEPILVLWQSARSKDKVGIEMVTNTCDQMVAGGIYDQIGGGFARYSVDEKWLVPHFEKMLYDNAQLIHLYLDAYLVSGEEKHANVVHDIIRYLKRDMTHKDGGWYSAEDADSEGQEGKFYCWTKKQLEEILTEEEAKLAIDYFGITEKGNFEDHSHPDPLKNLNVLSIVDSKITDEEKTMLTIIKKKMDTARNKRIRPHLDDKILSSWNGLMLGAIARASAVLNEDEYLAIAEKNYTAILKELWDPKTKTMYHRWRDGERDSVQLFDAYAFQLDGTLHLYEATLKAKYLEQAVTLANRMIELFYDKENGGFWQGTGNTGLIMRVKEDYDGAMPSANSVAALALLKLHKTTENKQYRECARSTLLLFSDRMEKQGSAVPYLLQALDFYLHEPYRVVVAGNPEDKEFQSALHEVHNQYQPNRVVIGNHGPVEEFAKKQTPEENGSPLVYVCSGSACQIPTIDPKKFKSYLKPSPPKSQIPENKD